MREHLRPGTRQARSNRAWKEDSPFPEISKRRTSRDQDASVRRFGERPYGPAEKLTCTLLRAAFALNSRSRGAQLYAVAWRPVG